MKMQGGGLKLYISRPPPLLPNPRTSAPGKQQLDFFLLGSIIIPTLWKVLETILIFIFTVFKMLYID